MLENLWGGKGLFFFVTHPQDGALLVSGSSDKNLRIWGLDFGDCHKSIFGHEDSITCVRFLPGTHLLFSCGKDGAIKCWDADSFQHVQSLKVGGGGGAIVFGASLEGGAVLFFCWCGKQGVIRISSKGARLSLCNLKRVVSS